MNVYQITLEKCEKVIDADVINVRTHYVEAENYSTALRMINNLYAKFEDAFIVDIIKCERIAKDIIHNK